MNKKLYFLATAAGLMTLASCSSDNDAPATQEKGINEITIAVTNTNANSRVARQLWSSEGANEVNSVKAALYKQNTSGEWEAISAGGDEDAAYTAIENFNKAGWTGPQPAVTPGTTSSKETKTIKLGILATSAKYCLVSYAWNDPAEYTLGATWDLTGAYPFTTVSQQKALSGQGGVEEVFAGTIYFETDDEGLIDDNSETELVMERSVAGVLGYFTNVPKFYKKEGKTYAVAGVAVTIASQAESYYIPYYNRGNKASADNIQNQVASTPTADYEKITNNSGANQYVPALSDGNTILEVEVPDV